MPTQPEYLRVIDEINARIASGKWPPGHRLDTPPVLAETYGTSVGTVRRALDLLKDRGVLIGRPGKGVYVAGRVAS